MESLLRTRFHVKLPHRPSEKSDISFHMDWRTPSMGRTCAYAQANHKIWQIDAKLYQSLSSNSLPARRSEITRIGRAPLHSCLPRTDRRFRSVRSFYPQMKGHRRQAYLPLSGAICRTVGSALSAQVQTENGALTRS